MIVRPVEYIIGRLDGRFAPPNDSLSYRRNNKKRKQKDDNNIISSVRSHENYNNNDHFAINDNINKNIWSRYETRFRPGEIIEIAHS